MKTKFKIFCETQVGLEKEVNKWLDSLNGNITILHSNSFMGEKISSTLTTIYHIVYYIEN